MIFDHKHLIVNAAVAKPPLSVEEASEWMLDIVKSVDMKVLIPPQSVYCDTVGNEGVTGICCIETSHLSMHSWHLDSPPRLKFDLYSCKYFDPELVFDKLSVFKPYYYNFIIVDRNDTRQAVNYPEYELRQVAKIS